MCPNRELVSLYHDEELPSPWKEKMEAHLESCPACRSILEKYGQLGENLKEVPAEAMLAAQERVWAKLSQVNIQPLNYVPVKKRVHRLWKKTVTLPLPAAVAAAFLVFMFFALLGFRTQIVSDNHDTIIATGIGLYDHIGTIPMQDMTNLLHYLTSHEGRDFMIIRLPDNRNFSRMGEPTLIHAADYSRGRRNPFR